MPYHITARSINREWFSIEMVAVWKIMTTHLQFIHRAYNIRILAFVLMNNHFHMIAQAPNGNLSEAMRFFMSETGRDLRRYTLRINRVFGSRFHRSLLLSPHYYLHAYKYVYRNPVEAGLVKNVEDYPFSTLPGLLGNSRLDISICDDLNWENLGARQATLDWLNQEPNKLDWERVAKGLSRSEFKLSRDNARLCHLEIDAL
jgi:Transposase and inactivated derivatives